MKTTSRRKSNRTISNLLTLLIISGIIILQLLAFTPLFGLVKNPELDYKPRQELQKLPDIEQTEEILNKELRTKITKTMTGFTGGFLEVQNYESNEIKYYSEKPDLLVGFGLSTISLAITSPIKENLNLSANKYSCEQDSTANIEHDVTTVILKFIGSNKVIPEANKPTGVFNQYFIGNDQDLWVRNEYHQEILYKNLYDNIDLVYSLKNGELKYDFIVYPGGNPDFIKLHWKGPISINVVEEGINIKISTKTSEYSFIDTLPINYQNFYREDPFPGYFCLFDSNTYGFYIPHYDRNKVLIIDPVLSLEISTYVGGEDLDESYDITVDSKGDIYVCGGTRSTYFPVFNPYDGSYNEGGTYGSDVFVFKLASNGSTMLYSTYIGGTEDDIGKSLAIDTTNNIYVTGFTYSDNFPTSNANDSTYGGSMDAFVFKLASNGSSLYYSTYIGDTGTDHAYSIALDDSNNAYVAGLVFAPGIPGMVDVLVFKLSPDGKDLIYSKNWGGTSLEIGRSITVDTGGNAYVTGETKSTDFPTVNPYNSTGDGSTTYSDVFVFKLAADGNSLLYSTYISGSHDEISHGIVVDTSGNVTVTGETTSIDFPTVNPYNNTGDGSTTYSDVFVFKLTATGNNLIYSTYISGSNNEIGYGITLDGENNTYITGETTSTDFPTVYALESSNSGYKDVFVCKLAKNGSTLLYSTYLGGDNADIGKSIVIDFNNKPYVTGSSLSDDFPTTNRAFNRSKSANIDIFVSKLTIGPNIKLITPENNSDQMLGSHVYLNVTGSNGTLWYSWDGNLNATASTSTMVDLLIPTTEGLHTLHLYTVSDFQLWEKSYYEFTIDNTPPEITLNDPINGTTQESGISINLTITGSNGSFVYHWDTDANMTVISSYDPILPIGDGIHQLYVYAKDIAGNWAFAYFEFITDDTPLITLNNPKNGTSQQSGILINLTITGSNGSLVYHWDTDANATVISSYDPVLPIGDGIHRLYVYAKDDTGNWAYAYFEFITDDTPPQITLVNPENRSRQITGTMINITFVGDNGSFIYNWNGEQNVTGYTGDTITLPTEPGLYQLHIFVYDDAGNVATGYFEFTVIKKPSDGLLMMLLTLIVTTSIVISGIIAFFKLKPIIKEKYLNRQLKNIEENPRDSLEEITGESDEGLPE